MVSVQRDGDNLLVDTPYSEEFVTDLKRHVPRDMRKWDADKKVWRVSVKAESSLLAILREVFGYAPGERPVVVELLALRTINSDSTVVVVAGKKICSSSGRDSGAWVGPGVVLKSGKIGSGGSRNHPSVWIEEGSIFETELFEDAIMRINLAEWEVRKTVSGDQSEEEQRLLAEKQQLLSRLEVVNLELQKLQDKQIVSAISEVPQVCDALKD